MPKSSFYVFIDFLNKIVEEFSIPGFAPGPRAAGHSFAAKSLKTTASDVEKKFGTCTYHPDSNHQLSDCRALNNLPYKEVRDLALAAKVCFRCLKPHLIKNCTSRVKCEKCGKNHVTAMHNESYERKNNWTNSHKPVPKEMKIRETAAPSMSAADGSLNLCTVGGSSGQQGSIYSKTVLVEVRSKNSDSSMYCYCIIDEQSNTSFLDHKIIDFLDLSPPETQYFMTTMQGISSYVNGYIVNDLEVRGVYENIWITLPQIFTNDSIPDTRFEVATSSDVIVHPQISHLADNFIKSIGGHEVLMLIGSNCGPAMATKVFGDHAPFAHHTALGWALVGPSGINESTPNAVVLKTSVRVHDHFDASIVFPKTKPISIDSTVENIDDELLGPSKEDYRFIELMNNEVTVTKEGNLQLPLPFKDHSPLPDNKFAVYGRSYNTLQRLQRDPEKLDKCIKVMANYIRDGHVRQIPLNELETQKGKAWWLPVFAVTHPKKSKVRIVFDSSASFSGISLNNKLMQGPDNNNLLLGVLLRFRLGEIGFCGDIEHMFHCFYVSPEYCNYLRFYWYDSNDPASNKIVEFQAMVHVFGNTSSPAVANFGLRYAAENSPCGCPESSREFVKQSMYVDDGISSASSVEEAIRILKGAKELLAHYNIRLHKITSNSDQVIKSFPSSECAEEVKLLISNDTVSATLGLSWKTKSDELVLRSIFQKKPFTKRGVLSVNSSNYDPLGITAPVTLGGRLFQRMILPPKSSKDNIWKLYDWDDPLPEKYLPQWNKWVSCLSDIPKVSLQRCYTPVGFGEVTSRTLHVYCDASKDAISYVSYLQSFSKDGSIHVSFVMANSKVSPRLATSIPRMELCAGVEAVVASRKIVSELHSLPDQIKYYTDSKILLGYLSNQEKRFARYVTRRVELILSYSDYNQWCFVATDENPADIGTHPHTPNELMATNWLSGPVRLWNPEDVTPNNPIFSSLILPEIVEEKAVLLTKSIETTSVSRVICSRTNDWNKALCVLSLVMKLLYSLDLVRQRNGVSLAPRAPNPTRSQVVEMMIVNMQDEVYSEEKIILTKENMLPNKHPLSSLSPFEDGNNLLRVGGRLSRAALPYNLKHPILLPKDHPVSRTILHHYHHKTMHAGRHITHGALREAGFYMMGSLKIIKQLVKECCICRVLRAPTQTQMMSDLPVSRLEETPPFSNVGLDVFGPYLVHDGLTTRRSKATKKLWGLLFTCFYSRAVHVEPLQSMDISSFRNALRRFWSIRGTCKLMVSDRGTNFLGAKNQMESADVTQLQKYAQSQEVQWDFITPGASYQGGVWERKVGAIKSVLNATLRLLHSQALSRDELSTLFYEASSIVNNTPMWEISADLESPFPLFPSMLLNLKEVANPPQIENFSKEDLLSYGRARWRRVQYLADQFWCRWKTNYVTSLQARHKWKGKTKCVNVGDVVLVKQKSKRNLWPIAIVTNIKKSVDNLIRSVTLKLPSKDSKGKHSYLERSLHDTVLLIPSKDHKC